MTFPGSRAHCTRQRLALISYHINTQAYIVSLSSLIIGYHNIHNCISGDWHCRLEVHGLHICQRHFCEQRWRWLPQLVLLGQLYQEWWSSQILSHVRRRMRRIKLFPWQNKQENILTALIYDSLSNKPVSIYFKSFLECWQTMIEMKCGLCHRSCCTWVYF